MRQYNARNVNASFKGIPLNVGAGLAPDSFMTVEREEDGWETTVGADGFTVRSRNNNRLGKVTFRTLASSPLNDALASVANLDELTGAGSGPFFFSELNSTATASSPTAWIMKQPSMERGKAETEVEWVLQCEELEMFAGGRLA
jgi:hypothetical protein